MRLIFSEQQVKNILLEETLGLDAFLNKVVEKYPESKDHINVIKEFILNSNCKKIEIGKVNGAYGVSLSDRVLISDICFNQTFQMFLFILFHEIAHQYQYKKYGEEKMYEVYLGDLSMEEAAKWMKQIEIVADEFAGRKVRELRNLGAIPKDTKLFQSFYMNIPTEHFVNLISKVKAELKKQNITDPSEVSEIIYNWVRPRI